MGLFNFSGIDGFDHYYYYHVNGETDMVEIFDNRTLTKFAEFELPNSMKDIAIFTENERNKIDEMVMRSILFEMKHEENKVYADDLKYAPFITIKPDQMECWNQLGKLSEFKIVDPDKLKFVTIKEKKMEEQNDPTNPDYYKQGGVECIDAIEASMTPEEFSGYLKGNAMKYLFRYGRKYKDHERKLEDLGKAKWYISKLIEKTSSEKTPGGNSSEKSYTPDGDISSYVMDEFSKSFDNPPFAYPPEEGEEEDDGLREIADIMEGIADSFRNLRTDD